MVSRDAPVFADRCQACERCENCGSEEWGRGDVILHQSIEDDRFAHCHGCGAFGPVPGEPESRAAFEAEVAAQQRLDRDASKKES